MFKPARFLVKTINRRISNHNFETEPIIPLFWRGKSDKVDESRFIIDTTNENLMDGPSGNPALARKMLETYKNVGLVLMRGNRDVGDHLDKMRDWAKICFPSVSKYEGALLKIASALYNSQSL